MEKWYEKTGPENDVVLSTCIRLNRNLRDYPFSEKMSRSHQAAVTKCVLQASKDSCILDRFQLQYLPMEQLTKTEMVSLVELQLANPEFISVPEGRGVLLSGDESVSILLNGENHLQVQANEAGLDFEKAYRAADELDSLLEKNLTFAFDETLGYLTQNPMNLGTGLSASLSLHLPALQENGGAARISASLAPLGLSLRAGGGKGSEPKGAVYYLSNRVSLGLSESEAISNLQNIAMQIITQERAARDELVQELEVQDTICRSLGILKSARIMSYEEFQGLISNVRFGISAGLITEIGYEIVDRLSFEMQPATLLVMSGKKLTVNERRNLRAQKIKEILKN